MWKSHYNSIHVCVHVIQHTTYLNKITYKCKEHYWMIEVLIALKWNSSLEVRMVGNCLFTFRFVSSCSN